MCNYPIGFAFVFAGPILLANKNSSEKSNKTNVSELKLENSGTMSSRSNETKKKEEEKNGSFLVLVRGKGSTRLDSISKYIHVSLSRFSFATARGGTKKEYEQFCISFALRPYAANSTIEKVD